MYVPGHFAEADPAKLHDFIEQYSFGLLISTAAGEPFATHLPFLLERGTGRDGCLVGHMARANPHWQQAAGQTLLALFSGPHAYISPSWYEAEQVVPTWNYVAVHAYGRLEVLDDPAAKLDIVRQGVQLFEQPMPQPWTLPAAGPYLDRLLAQIVGFRIPIERLEGKWKLNQNHPAERRAKVVRQLRERTDDNAQEIAALMSALPAESGS